MNLVDSSGWLEYFSRGPYGQRFTPLIQRTDELVVPTICIYEVFKHIAQQRNEEDALQAIGWMTLGHVVDLNQELAILAAGLSIEHKLPMADSMILATAYMFRATLWTMDEHFTGLERVEYIKKE